MFRMSAIEVGKPRLETAGRSSLFDVPRARSKWRRSYRQRSCRQTIHSHDQEHTQPAQDRGKDGQDWRPDTFSGVPKGKLGG